MTINKLLPRSIDNTYDGRRFAIWLLAIIVLGKGFMALNCIFNGHNVAISVDRIPLATFTPAGANAVVSLLALWGLSQLIFSLLGGLALLRYRAMVPLMFVLLLIELLGRRLILVALPIVKMGPPAVFPINLVLFCLLVLGLVLSLSSRGARS